MKRGIGIAIGSLAGLLTLISPANAARLTPAAQQAFDQYVVTVETRLARQHASYDTFLAALNTAPSGQTGAADQLRSRSLLIEPVNEGSRSLPGSLLHHWRGSAFVPGATSKDMLALLHDYNGLARYYSPEVESSRALAEHAGIATVAMRLRKQQVVTIVLDSEYDVQIHIMTANSGYSISRSTHIWEVESPGTPRERRMKEGDDEGFLWRLNSYWSFLELPDGLLIECEAVSLTRDIPSGLGWLAAPLVEQLPRESLEFTLRATRNALAAHTSKGIHL
jgi:hypothetical protein